MLALLGNPVALIPRAGAPRPPAAAHRPPVGGHPRRGRAHPRRGLVRLPGGRVRPSRATSLRRAAEPCARSAWGQGPMNVLSRLEYDSRGPSIKIVSSWAAWAAGASTPRGEIAERP